MTVIAFAVMLLCLCGQSRAEDYLSGWTEATGSIPVDVSNYYFAFVSMSDNTGLMMGTGLNGNYTTMYYRAAADPSADHTKAWLMESMDDFSFTYNGNSYSYEGKNCFTLRNLADPTYVYQTGQSDMEANSGGSYDFRVLANTQRCALSAAKFEWDATNGYWLVANGFHNIARAKSYYLGGWSYTTVDNYVAMNKTKDNSLLGKYKVYYILRSTLTPSLLPTAIDGYLYTMVNGNRRFLTRGYSWNTRAILGDDGVPMQIAATDASDGTTVKFIDSQRYLYSADENGIYTDGAADGNVAFTLSGDDTDGYILKANNAKSTDYVGYYDEYKLRHVADAGDALRWFVMSKEDYDHLMAEQENVRYAGYTAGAMASLPVVTAVATASDTGTSTIAEEFNQGSLSQEWNFTDLAAGIYRVSLKAFHRAGTYTNVFAQAALGYDEHQTFLTVNGQKVRIASILSSRVTNSSITSDSKQSTTIAGNTYYIPDNLNAATDYFNAGYYNNIFYVSVSDNGTINVKLTRDGCIASNWTAWRDLTVDLVYSLANQPASWTDVDAGSFCLENNDVATFLATADYTQQGATSVVPTDIRNDQPLPVTILLPLGLDGNIQAFVSENADYSGAMTQTIEPMNLVANIYNLVPGRTYYYKVEDDGEIVTTGHFATTGTVRMIKTDAGSNIRDLGGRITTDGKRVRYGRLFRGGEMHAGSTTTLTAADKTELLRLDIRAELDLRAASETGGSAPAASALDGATYQFIDLVESGTALCSEAANRAKIATAIHFVAEQMAAGRPVYFHCIWGADRTGAMGLFLESILGFTLDDIYKDFELTSFSKAGHRAANWPFGLVLEDKIIYCEENYAGATIQDKVVAFLKDCGVTDADIAAIRSYMLEDDAAALAARYATQKAYFQSIITLASATWDTTTADATSDLAALTTEFNRAMNALTTEVDFTSLLSNPNFESGKNGWVDRGTVNHGGLSGNKCAEVFQSASSMRQSLNDLPAGSYILKAQGYQNNGGSAANSYNAYVNGTTSITSYLLLNQETQTLLNLFEDAQNTELRSGDAHTARGVYVPNSMNGASTYFSSANNLYWNVVRTTTDAVGCITVGAAQTGTAERDWTVFDNFHLYYRGASFAGNTTLALDETATNTLPAADGYYTVSSNRTLAAGKWNTVCLPFDLTAAMMSSAHITDARQLSDVQVSGDNVSVVFEPVAEMKAGRPYIVKVSQDWNVAANDVLVRAKQPISTCVNNSDSDPVYAMTGTYAPAELLGNYFISSDRFYYADRAKTTQAFRAYITLEGLNDNPVKSFGITTDQNTGIGEPLSDSVNGKWLNGKWFDLGGREIVNGQLSNGKLPRGIFISNGKKVVNY